MSFQKTSFRWGLLLAGLLHALLTSAMPPGEWRPGFGLPGGTDGEVNAVLRAGNELYVGGSFRTAGSVVAYGIARWDGAAWHSLGTGRANGINQQEDHYRVTALAVAANGDLYAGGDFDRIGGIASPHLARWDGQRWHAAKGLRGPVQALAVASNGDVYAAGHYGTRHQWTTYLARWNGWKWQQLGAALTDGTGSEWLVSSLAAAPEGGVYVGGSFHRVGGHATSAVARFDGRAWHPFEPTARATSRRYNQVHRLLVAGDGRVYAGGRFVQPNDSLAAGVAWWSNGAWRLLGPANGPGSATGFLEALASTATGELYAGGYFFQQHKAPVHGVLRWNGAAWQPLSADTTTRLPGSVASLSLGATGELYAGGNFERAGAALLNHLARWDGAHWQPLGSGPGGPPTGDYAKVETLARAPDGTLYGSGRFCPAVGPDKKVARWDGHRWQPLDPGPQPDLDLGVDALAVAPNGEVYVGGNFTRAGGRPARGIARWDGHAWHPLGAGMANEGYGGTVFALAVAPNGDVYAGGVFSRAGEVPASYVARWDGRTWHPLGTGPSNGVDAGRVTALLVAPTGDVYVAGFFKHAGDVEASCIARWDGTAWHRLGTGVELGVNTLALGPAGDLYAGGLFHQAGGVPANGVARWDGTRWLPLGAGVGPDGDTMGTVGALAVASTGEVYVSGAFQWAGAVAARYLACWDGRQWSCPGHGLNSPANSLAVGADGCLYAAGGFSATGDNLQPLVHFGTYCPGSP